MTRCLNPRNKFPYYGAAGVPFERPGSTSPTSGPTSGRGPGHHAGQVLDQGDYAPGNVAWMTTAEQQEQARLKRERRRELAA